MDMGLSENKGMPQKEVLTRSPYVNELIRICREVKEGKKDPQELRTQLDSLKEMIDTLDVTADALKLTQPKSEGFEEEGEKDKELIPPALEKIQKASSTINEAQEKIAEEIREIVEAKSMRVCMRCGAKTPIKEKYCTSCNALLPPLPQEAMPSHALDLTVGEAVVQQEQRLVPPNVRKIYESALKVGRGEISKEEFKETIDWYEGIIEKTKKEMTKIAKPKKLGEEEEIVFEDTKKLLEDGVKEAEEGINELKKYMEDEDKEHLIKGVNTLMDAGEKLYQVKQIGEKARREMERQKQRKK